MPKRCEVADSNVIGAYEQGLQVLMIECTEESRLRTSNIEFNKQNVNRICYKQSDLPVVLSN